MKKSVWYIFIVLSGFLFIHSSVVPASGQSNIVSDDFFASSLNTSIWTYINPLGDSTLTATGTQVSISVPAGTSHDVSTGGNRAPRIMQQANNTDFEVEVKFDSGVSAQYQMQGLIIEQDSSNYLRFDFYSTTSETRIFAQSFTNGSAAVKNNSVIGGIPSSIPLYMRVNRQGNVWTQSYSFNGADWTSAVVFTRTLNVTKAGPFAANHGNPGSSSPGFTCLVDYFFNTASPIVPEDGGTSAPTVINIWYGDYQRFGHIGNPQNWVNILGDVSDLDGIASLKYSLNGGPEMPLSIGPDTRRLAAQGDFNVEIAYTDLLCGLNQVTITATDTLGNTAVKTVDVEYTCGQTWPETYSINWGSIANIQDAAQVVDGKWTLETDSLHMAVQDGASLFASYDRLVAIGDVSWDDYEVTAPITIHTLSTSPINSGTFVGLVMRWQGHYDWDGGQPRNGWYPLGAIGVYDFVYNYGTQIGDFRLRIVGNNSTAIAEDMSGRHLQVDVRYMFKMRVETSGTSSAYYFKVWEDGTSEPSGWDISGMGLQGELKNGSVVLVAHEVDANFGNVAITPGPFIDSPPVLSNIQAEEGTYSAEISWVTNKPSTSSVSFGLSTAYENGSIQDSAMVTNHTITLTGLNPETLYHYRITSVDASGNSSSSSDITFTTNPGVSGGQKAIYSFDEGSGTIATDLSGNGNNGTINGAAWTTGKTGSGLSFDGINDYVGASHSNSLNITDNKITLSAWVYYVDNENHQIIIAKPFSSTTHASPYFSYGLHMLNGVGTTDGTPRFWLTINGVGKYATSSAKIAQNQWNHIAGVYDGSTMKIYVNGVQSGTTSVTGNVTGYNTPLRVGANGGLTQVWKGKIDEVGIYNIALTSLEIMDLYKSPLRVANFSASDNQYSQVTLSWTNPSDTDLAEVVVQRNVGSYPSGHTNGVNVYTNNSPAVGVPVNFVDTGVSTDVIYYYAVFSKNIAGSWNDTVTAGKNADTGIALVSPDTTPPTISNIQPAFGDVGAIITWDTNEPSTSRVDYGTTTAYGGFVEDAMLVTSHTVEIGALSPGTEYHYKVTSSDGSGNGASSLDQTFTTTNVIPPSKVIGFTASDTQYSQVTLGWTNPSDSDLAEVVVQRKEGSYPAGHADGVNVYTNSSPAAGVPVNAADTGVINDVTYYYAVFSRDTALNWNDTVTAGQNADTGVSLVTPDTTPPVISSIQAAPGDTGAAITWDTDEAATSRVDYGTTTAYGSFVESATPVTAHTVALSVLMPGTEYHYKVTSADGSGNGASSPDQTFTTTNVTPPYRVTDFSASDTEYSQITLGWTNPADADLAEVVVQRKEGSYPAGHADGVNVYTNSSPAAGVPVNAADTGVINDVTYYYAVFSRDTAVNWNDTVTAGQNADTGVSLVTPDTTPPVISSIQAAPGDTGAAITWDTDEAATSRVDYGTTTAYGSFVESAAPVTSHTGALSALSPGTEYHYKVTSSDGSGNGASSLDQTFTTTNVIPPSTVIGFTASDTQYSQITLGWTNPADADLAEVVVQRNEGGYPVDHTDGVNVYTNTSPTAGGPVNAADTGVINDVTYYYAVFSRDTAMNWNDTVTAGQNADTGVSLVTPDTTPPVISSVQGAPDDTGAAITWDTDEAATSRVDYGTTTAYGSFVETAAPVTSHTGALSGLMVGTEYHYKVTSSDGSGNGASSLDQTFTTTNVIPPAVVADFTASDTEYSQITLGWTNPADADLAEVVVQRKEGSYPAGHADGVNVYTNSSPAAGVPVNAADTGVINDVTYYYAVFSRDTAVNWNDTVTAGQNADTGVSLVTPDTTPPVISSIQAVPGDTGAAITWDTDEAATSRVDYGITTAYGSFVESATPVTAHTGALSVLMPGTEYHYKVTSADGSGNSASSPDLTFTTTNVIPPSTVIDFTASDTEYSQITLDWTNPADADLAEVVVQRKEGSYPAGHADGVNVYTNSSPAAGVPVNVADTGVINDVTYYYAVFSRDTALNWNDTVTAGQNADTGVSLVTPDTTPPVISSIQAAPGDTGAAITWDTDEAATSRVDYGTTTAYGSFVETATLVTSHTGALSGLMVGTEYHYKVTSSDGSGNGASSPDQTFTTTNVIPPSTVIDFTASDTEYSQITLDWTNPADADLAEVVVQRKEGSYPAGHADGVNVYTNSSPAAGGPVNAADTGVINDVTYYYAVFSRDTAMNWNDTVTAGQNADTGVSLVTPDTTPPVISSIQAAPGDTGAAITWDTDEAATSRVDYGTTTAYGSFVETAALVTSHTGALSGLMVGTEYHYKVTSSDGSGNGASSLDQTFTTTNVIPPSTVIDFTASDTEYSQITLDWTNPADADLAEVVVQRKEGSYPAGHADGVNVYTNSSPTAGGPVNAADTGVINDVTYYYAVFSRDTAMNWNDTVTAGQNADTGVSLVTPDTTPPVISSIQAVPGDTGASITWDTDEAATSRVDYGITTAYGSFVESATPVTAHTGALSVLMPGTEYHYKVTSADGSGNGASSPDQTFTTTNVIPPAVVADFTASDTEYSQITLGWTNPTDADLAEVVVQRSEGGYPVNHTDGVNVYTNSSPAAGGPVNAADTGVINDVTYYYAVFSRDTAMNWNDTVTAGQNADTGVSLVTPDTTPPVISSIQAAPGDTGAAITWDTDEAATSRVDYGTTTAYGSFVETATLVTSHTGALSGLMVGTEYHYKVTSSDGSGNGASSLDQTFTTTNVIPPSTVIDFTASDTQYSQITLGWTNPADADLAEVVVQRKEGSYPAGHADGVNVYTNSSPTAGGPVNAADTGVINDVTYYYAVFSRDTAMNWNDTVTAGQNADTGVSLVTPDTTPPVISSIQAAPGDTGAAITWDTDEAATSRVDYGTTTAYGSFVESAAPVTSHTGALSALSPGTEYHYKVTSSDGSGNGASSLDQTFTTTNVIPPSTVIGFTASDTQYSQITLGWTNPADADLAEVVVQRKEGSYPAGHADGVNVYTNSSPAAGVPVNAADTGVINDVTYYYAVFSRDTAVNWNDTVTAGQNADTGVSLVTPDTTPPVISSIQAAPGDTGAAITWDTDEAATSRVDYGTTTAYGSFVETAALVTSHTGALSGLMVGTEYHYKVTSSDGSGNGASSLDQTFTTTNVIPPAVVADFTASDTEYSQITLGWTNPADADLAEVVVQRKEGSYPAGHADGVNVYTNSSPAAGVPVNAADTGVINDVTYYYAVFSRDTAMNWNDTVTAGQNADTGVSLVTPDTTPPVISSIQAAPGDTGAAITWDTDEAATSRVDYGTTTAYGSFVETAAPVTSHTGALSALSPGTEYHYKVTSSDGSGNGASSLDQTFTTTNVIPPSTVIDFTASDTQYSQITLGWTNPADADLAEVVVQRKEGSYPAGHADGVNVYTNSSPAAGVPVNAADTGVINDVTYYYAVFSRDTAVNWNDTVTAGQNADTGVSLVTPDTTPPVISSIQAAPGDTGAAITWDTDEAATSRVDYGTTTAYGSFVETAALVTSHTGALSGLMVGTEYHYKVTSSDGSGNGASSLDQTFTTTNVIPPAVVADFTASDTEYSQITLGWTNPADADLAEVVVQRKEGSYPAGHADGVNVYTNSSPAAGVPVNAADTGVINDVTYYYAVFSRDTAMNWNDTVTAGQNADTGVSLVTPDTTPPVISSIQAAPGDTGAAITWDTDEAATSRVDYGTTTAYGSFVETAAPVTSHTGALSALSPGTEYHYKVTSSDGSGNGASSLDQTFTTTNVIPPSTVIDFTASDTQYSQITLGWTNPADADLAEVVVQRKEGSYPAGHADGVNVYTNSSPAAGVPVNAADTGVINDVTYYYAVFSRDTAVNWNDTVTAGQNADTGVSLVTPDTTPPVISSIQAAPGDTGAAITWDTDEAATSRVDYGTTTAYGSFVESAAPVTSHTGALSALSPGTEYHYKVTSSDGSGNGASSLDQTFTTTNVIPPSTVIGFTASDTQYSQITLGWTNPADADLAEVVVQRKEGSYPAGHADGVNVYTNSSPAAGVPVNAADTGVINDVTYYYAVFSRDTAMNWNDTVTAGQNADTGVSLVTPDTTPPVISSIQAAPGDTGAAITWDTDEAATSRVDYGTTTAYGSFVETAALVTSHTGALSGLMVGTEYHYKVTSLDGSGNGASSLDQTFTTTNVIPPSTVIDFTASDTQYSQITLDWTNPADADLAEVVVQRKEGSYPAGHADGVNVYTNSSPAAGVPVNAADTGVINDVTYYYAVFSRDTAVNWNDTVTAGQNADTGVSLVTPDTTPPVISSIQAAPGDTGAAITWDTDEAATSRVDYGTTTAYGSFVETAALVTSHTGALSGLMVGTEYHYKVTSLDGSGNGASSLDQTFTTTNVIPPSTVIDFTASDTQYSQITLDWTNPADADLAEVVVQRKEGSYPAGHADGVNVYTNSSPAAGVPVNAADTGVINDVTYYYAVFSRDTAVNWNDTVTAGQNADTGVSLVTPDTTPPVISSIQAAPGDTGAAITWDTDEAATSRVDYGTTTAYGSFVETAALVTSHTGALSGLMVGTEYHYKVTSSDGSGNGASSLDQTFTTTNVIPPSTVIGFTASDTQYSQITLGWTNPADADLAEVVVQRKEGSYPAGHADGVNVYTNSSPAAGVPVNAADTGVINDVTYYYAVFSRDTAVNWNDTVTAGQNADTGVSLVTPDTTPPVISSIQAAPGDTGAAITWDTDEAATSRVDYGTTTAYGSFVESAAPVTSHTGALSALSPGTEYHYKVTSSDGSGNGASSLDQTFTTTNVIPPSTVIGFTASDTQYSQITLGWTNPADADLAEVVVQRKEGSYPAGHADGVNVYTNSSPAAGVPVNAADTGVINDVTYYYAVFSRDTAVNWNDTVTAGQNADTGVSLVTPDTTPPVISSIQAAPGDTGAAITWDTDEAATSRVDYGTTTAYGSFVETAALVTSHTGALSGLMVGTEYHYKVTSSDGSGNGASSLDQTFTTTNVIPPAVVADFTASDTEYSQITLGWTNPADADLAEVVVQRKEGSYPAGHADGVNVYTNSSPAAGVPVNAADTGVINDVTYYYAVFSRDTAMNWNDTVTAGQNADTGVSLVTPDTTPPVISSIQAAPGDTGAAITWDTDEAATSRVDYGTTTAYGSFVETAAPVTSHTGALSALSPGTEYHYKVTSSDGSGNGASSLDQTFTTTNVIPPSTVIDFTASDTQYSQITLGWTNPADADLAEVVVQRKEGSYPAGHADGVNVYTNSSPAAGVPVNAADTGVINDVTYYYAVFSRDTAVNWNDTVTAGQNADTGVSLVTPDTTPPVISSIQAAPGDTGAAITWDTDEAATSRVDYGTTTAYGSFVESAAPVTSHTGALSALSPGTEYHYKVTSSDGSGNGASSLDQTFTTTNVIPPSTVIGFTASDTQYSQITLGWTNPADADLAEVVVQRKEGSYPAGHADGVNVYTNSSPAAGVPVNAADTGVINDVTYYYAVFSRDTAMNWNDTVTAGQNADTGVSLVTPDTTPPVISSIQAAPGDTGAAITWDTDEAATSRVDYGTTTAYGSFVETAALVTSHTGALSGLMVGTEYHYKVTSLDGSGNGASSLDQTFTTTNVIPPSTVIDFTASDTQYSQITLDWTNPADADLAEVVVQRKEGSYPAGHADGVNVYTNSSPAAGVPVNAADTGVINDVTYYYAVFSRDTAVNWNDTVTAGQNADTGVSLVTPDTTPPVISSIQAAPGDTGAAITWDTDEAATSRVDYGTTTAYGSFVETAALVTSHTGALSGLMVGTEYHYKVTSLDGSGNGASSLDQTFTTTNVIPPSTVIDFTASDTQYSQITLDWTNPADADLAEVVVQRKEGSYPAGHADGVNVYTNSSPAAGVPVNAADTGVINDVTYYYAVFSRDTAVNWNDTVTAGQNADTGVSLVTPDTTPPVISSIQAAPGDTGAAITWDTDEAATSRVDYGTTTAYGSFVETAALVTSHTGALSGLMVGTEYHYKVTSSDGSGNGASSLDQTFTTTNVIPPSTVIGFTASDTQYSQITLGWTNPADADLAEVVVQRKEGSYPAGHADGVNVYTNSSPAAGVPVNAADTGVINDVTYYYAVFSRDTAVNWNDTVTAGQNADTGVSLVTPDTTPPVISSIQAAPGDTGAAITWDTDEAATSRVDYGTTTAYGSFVETAALVTSHTGALSGLMVGTEYHYKVTSLDGSGNGASSLDQTFTTTNVIPPSTVIDFTASDTQYSQITLDWTNPADADLAEVVVQRKEGSYPAGHADGVNVYTNSSPAAGVPVNAADTGVINDVTYYYAVFSRDTAVNWNDTVTAGQNADTGVSLVTPDTTPPVISSIQAAPGDTGAAITWDTDEAATSRVDYGTTTAYGSFVETAALVTSHTGALSGLMVGTEYHYKVTSLDGSGNGASSLDQTFTTTNVIPPSTVIDFTASDTQYSQITLDWTNPADADLAEVVVQRKEGSYPASHADGVNVYTNSSPAAGVPVNAADTGVINDVTYYYAVFSRDTAVNWNDTVTAGQNADTGVSLVTSVLKAFYTFDEGAGTAANDSSGNSNTGVINGAAWTTGKSGGGLSFDGINDYVEASHSNSLNITDNKITLSAWVYYVDNENHQIIIAKPFSSTTHASPYFSYCLHVLNGVGTTDGTPRFWLTINGVGKYATSGVKIAQNQWNHITGVYDGSVMKIYINGVLRGTTSVTGNVTGYNTPLRVGANGGLTQVWKGILDDVSIYNKALSGQEVQDLYTQYTPPSQVANFTASDSQYAKIILDWTNPSDSDLAEVVVQRKEGGYPAGHTDGVNVYTNASPTVGASMNFEDTGVGAGVTYYYAVFSRDATGNWNDTVTVGQNADAGVSLVTPDTTPPVISNIQAVPGDTGAAITWDTDEAATSRVDYGTTTAYGSFVESVALVTAHTGALSGLMSGTEYHYKVTSLDGSGNSASSLDQTFTTSFPSVLKAFYTFDEGAGTAANDSSGNGNTGVINGAAWTTGKSGGGLSFDGINDYVEASHSNSLNITDNKITLSAWVYYVDNENHQIIIAKPFSSTTHASPYFSYCLHVLNGVGTTDGTPRFWLAINGVGKYATSSAKIAQNQWNHITGVYDGSVMKIYINGVLRGTTSVTGNVTGYNTPLRVGANGGLTQVWKGILDDVSIYNKALSDQEVQDLYTQ